MTFALTIQGSALPAPVVTFSVERGRWILAEDYCYTDPHLGVTLCIPAGFSFDLASIPRLLWWLIAPFELSITAPLIHDFLYRCQGHPEPDEVTPWRSFDRKEADQLFERIMAEEGVSWWRRKAAYRAVRLFGGW